MERDDYLVFVSIAIFLGSFVTLLLAFNSIDEYRTLVTGFAVTSGGVSLNISFSALLDFTDGVIAFGAGSVTPGETFATIDTLGIVVNGNWTPTTTRFLISNIGNVNLTINISSGKSASLFIGGTSPEYKYNVSDGGKGICDPPSGFSLDTFYEINVTGDSRRVCDKFESSENITIDLKLVIPNNSNVGILSDTLTIEYGSV